MARIEPTLGYEHLRQTPDDGKRTAGPRSIVQQQTEISKE